MGREALPFPPLSAWSGAGARPFVFVEAMPEGKIFHPRRKIVTPLPSLFHRVPLLFPVRGFNVRCDARWSYGWSARWLQETIGSDP